MFDSHTHYDDEAFGADREELLEKLFAEQNVSGIVSIGCSQESSLAALRLAETHENVYAAVGIHPEHAEKLQTDWIESLLAHPKVIAIGEIGLDYHYDTPTREVQKNAFRAQLAIAERTGFPVVIHDRDAHGDLLSILKDYPSVTGVFHSFSGSKEMAKELLKKGWYLSFSGVVTFRNARQLPEVAAMVPSDRFLTETDCPFLTPVPFRGQRNDSGKMLYTIQKLAEIRGESVETIARQAEENARRLFRIESKSLRIPCGERHLHQSDEPMHQ